MAADAGKPAAGLHTWEACDLSGAGETGGVALETTGRGLTVRSGVTWTFPVRIPGTPHLIHPHVQIRSDLPSCDPCRPVSSFGVNEISVVSPYRHNVVFSHFCAQGSHAGWVG